MEKPFLLLNLFIDSIQKKNEKETARYRQKILALELDSEPAVIAKYRLGLFTLYQEKKADEAVAIFKEVASCGIRCDDYYQSQITYAICLWSTGRHDLAIFELRKMLSQAKPQTIHEILGLDYLSIFLRDTNATPEEIAKINIQRINSLSAMLLLEKDIEIHASLTLELAAALEERGQADDIEKTRQILQKTIALNSQINKTTVTAARAALKRLNKIK
jgi:tetratricopeptide (TPR) repeat protein